MSDDSKTPKSSIRDNKMNSTDDSLEGRWSTIQGDYRKKYPELKDEDLVYTMDNFDAMIHRIAHRTNRTEEDVKRDIRSWKS